MKIADIIGGIIIVTTGLLSLGLSIYSIVTISSTIPTLQAQINYLNNELNDTQNKVTNVQDLISFLNGQINPLLNLTSNILDYQSNLQQANTVLTQIQEQYQNTANLSNYITNKIGVLDNNLNTVAIETTNVLNSTGFWTGQIATLSSLGLNLYTFQTDLQTTQGALNQVITNLDNANKTINQLKNAVYLPNSINTATILSTNTNWLCQGFSTIQEKAWAGCGPVSVSFNITFFTETYCQESCTGSTFFVTVNFDNNPISMFTYNNQQGCDSQTDFFQNTTYLFIEQPICWHNISISLDSTLYVTANIIVLVTTYSTTR